MLNFTKKRKRLLVVYVLGIYILGFFAFPAALADSLDNVKDVISDSKISVSADHAIQFTTSIDIGDDGYFEVVFPADLGNVSTGTCAGPDVTLSTTTKSFRCTYSTTPGAATTTSMFIEDIVNPATAGPQLILITTYNSSAVELEAQTVIVYITEGMSYSANVESSLTFSVATTTDIAEINGVTVSGTTTDTTIAFGVLNPGASTTLAQTLSIATNADGGFSCTVEQDMELTNGSSDNINSFDNSPDDTGSTTPHTWVLPSGKIDSYHTYGHMGVTTDDFTLSSLDFSGSKFTGLNGTAPTEIFYNAGPSDGQTLGVGLTHIGYTVEINGLQESGSYFNTLTYICTPNY